MIFIQLWAICLLAIAVFAWGEVLSERAGHDGYYVTGMVISLLIIRWCTL